MDRVTTPFVFPTEPNHILYLSQWRYKNTVLNTPSIYLFKLANAVIISVKKNLWHSPLCSNSLRLPVLKKINKWITVYLQSHTLAAWFSYRKDSQRVGNAWKDTVNNKLKGQINLFNIFPLFLRRLELKWQQSRSLLQHSEKRKDFPASKIQVKPGCDNELGQLSSS